MLACVSLVATVRKLQRLDQVGGGRKSTMPEFKSVEFALQIAMQQANCWVVGKGKFLTCRSNPISSDELLRMQVFAVLSLCWVEEQNAHVRDVIGGRRLCELPLPMLPRCHLEDAGHVHLADITNRSLLQSTPTAGESRLPSVAAHHLHVAAMWDDFACQSFHGRMLPGCCNLPCTNMCGMSEAALPTQLCSRCRRSRYCSTACQRQAWVGGGHRLVCGNGKWARN